MTLEEILEKLHSPTDHAITLENGELTALLEELKGLREENKVLISECDRLIKEKGELLSKVSGGDVLRICQLKEQLKDWKEEYANLNKISYGFYEELKEAKRLLKLAVEDYPDLTDMWRYADKVMKLIGGAEDENS